MEIITRQPRTNETPALRRIWRKAFGGSDEAAFFGFHYKPELCLAAVCDGAPVAAGYLLPAGRLAGYGSNVSCAMIYGVAALPECHGRGFGTAVVRDLISKGRGEGFGAIVLCPSEDALFEYYSSRTEFRDWFFTQERRFEAPPSDTPVILEKISAREYGLVREKLLTRMPHIEMDPRALEYQSLLCQKFGGGLFATPGGDACTVVECQPDGAVWVKELLPKYEYTVLSAIAAAYPAREYFVRTPARGFDEGLRRFGMLAAPPHLIGDSKSAFPWYGLAFD